LNYTRARRILRQVAGNEDGEGGTRAF